MDAIPILKPETIADDADWRPALRYLNRDGSRADLTLVGRDVACEISPVGTATTHVRKYSTGGAVYLDDGADGEVEFVFLKADLVTILDDLEGVATEFDVAYFLDDAGARRKVARQTMTLRPKVT